MALPTSTNNVTVRKLASTLDSYNTKLNTKFGNKADKVSGATNGHFAGLNSSGNLTDSGKSASDFATSAQGTKADSAIQGVQVNGTALTPDTNKVVNVTKSGIGLGNVTNDAQVKRTEMGAANGVATLGSDGKVPSTQLPSFVDDVVEGYYYNSKFYKESTHTTEITPEAGVIYVDLDTNKTYRWGGTTYVVISDTLALGETSSTAYRGDRGKIAYDHSQATHARSDATKTEASSTNGKIKINGTETTVYTHPTKTAATAAAVKVGNDALGHVVLGAALTASDVGAAASTHTHTISDVTDMPTLGTAAQKDVPASGNASSDQVVMGSDTRLTDSRTPTSHTHGNITNAGGITATAVDIANGDALVIVDASNTNKVLAKTSITFDGSTTTQALSKKGTWQTFLTAHQDISGKANIVSGATSGNFASLTAGGDLVDSGKKASDFATSGHTHTTTLASDSGTATVTLSHDATYKLTAGGTSVIFKTPADNNTDTKVKATAKTDNVAYKILATASASPTSGNATEAVYDTDITMNPSTNTIAANISGDAATASKIKTSAKIGDTNKPVYVAADGTVTAISYTIDKSVPSSAVFTDVSCTAVGNHYTPATDSSAEKDASGGTATQLPTSASGSLVQVVTGVTMDAKGHVTGVVSKGLWSPDNNSTYTDPKLGFGYASSTAGTSPAFTASITDYTLAGNGGLVAIKFSADVPASATLNISSKGAKSIYWKNAAITAGVIQQNDTALLVYDGNQYQLLAIDRSAAEMTDTEVTDLLNALT